MDRKIKDNDHHIPAYQQIIYDLADMGLGKVFLIMWIVIILVLGATLLSLKWFLAHFR